MKEIIKENCRRIFCMLGTHKWKEVERSIRDIRLNSTGYLVGHYIIKYLVCKRCGAKTEKEKLIIF